jgi:branched-chain amino acid transport system ATP-binding protein
MAAVEATAADKTLGAVLLAVDAISLSFGGVTALADVSFDIHEHEILAIIGPNGAGKSSMLNVINGFYHPQLGKITYKGVTRSRMKPHEAQSQNAPRPVVAGAPLGTSAG